MRHIAAMLLVLALACALVLVGCSAPASSGGSTSGSSSGSSGGSTGGGTAAQAVTVTMRNFAFDPADATVAVGGTVTFVNNDSVGHTVSVDGTVSGTLAPGASYDHTFAKAGTFPFSCTIHPQMQGTITVK